MSIDLRSRSPFSLFAASVFLIACIWVIFNTRRWNNREVLQWDSDGYYLYLPATLIHHDLLHLGFLDSIPATGKNGAYRFGQGAFLLPSTGKKCNKYTMGVALFELPFFLVAHAWCVYDIASDPADGYSPPYHLAVAFASAMWAWIGLLVLARFLRRYLNDIPTALCLFTIGLGTNLFFYSSYALGMGHPFLFFLCALLIERTDQWYSSPGWRSATVIGACIGLAAITRPTCILFAIIPLFWGLKDKHIGRGSFTIIQANHSHVLLALATAAVCVLPQLLFWKATSGHYLFYSYCEEGFDFLHPHIFEGLAGFRKGWLVYSPLMVLGIAGLGSMSGKVGLRSYPWMALCFYITFTYVTFSWRAWWYGGGFGSRVMIETIPLLALPMGLLVQKVIDRGRIFRALFCVIVLVGIGLNMFQQWQYLHGIMHYENMNRALYWQIFLAPSHEAAGIPLGH